MSKPPYTKAARRNSVQLDQTVELTNYSEDTSERVATWTATSASPHTVEARVDVRNTPRRTDTVRESGDADVDARIHIPDDADGVSGIRDGGGKGASTIDGEWRVLIDHDDQGGLIRLDCERMD